jgi:hypothetical protein
MNLKRIVWTVVVLTVVILGIGCLLFVASIVFYYWTGGH